MATSEQIVRTYEELAGHFDRQGEAPMRDRYLVLAADSALRGGMSDAAERLRGRLLQLNPHHLLRPFATLPEAMQSPDVQSYVSGLRRSYPPERAAQLLGSLGPMATEPVAIVPAATNPPGVLKVYRGQDPEPRPPAAAAPPAPALAPPPPQPAPQPVRPAAVAVAPRANPPAPPLVPVRPTPPPPPPTPSPDAATPISTVVLPHEETEGPAGAWVATVLFVIVLVGALALAVQTLFRPFWH
jgi:hypothetical protein